MNNRAAELYLDRLFGDRQGYVAVAYKDKGQSWQEHQFAWPVDKGKLLGWAQVHQDANVFVCPALRKDANTRKKGDMQPSRWLWADVDWQSVPADKALEVESRIKDIGTYVVNSGSTSNGRANMHVYVELNEAVSHPDFIKLNTGLRDYLYGDNKQADNSLLRLPGTTNWKTDKGSPVEKAVAWGNDRKASMTALMKRRAFRDAKVIADAEATEWTFTEVEGLPRRIRAKVNMPVKEAVARYHTRHEAVWAITGDLHKAGMGPDEIHSLMDKFPAALSKAADENGYDVHSDVDKRLLYDRTHNAPSDDDEDMSGEVFESMTLEEMRDSVVAEGVAKELQRREIRRAADMAEAVQGHTQPPTDASEDLSDALTAPPSPVQWLIEDMCSATATVVITGQFKTGKTKMMIASLISSLVDAEPFLGVKEVHVPEGGAVVGHWNLEMSRLDFVDKYARPVGIKNPHNVKLAHWRGYRVNILTEMGKTDAIDWLKSRQVNVWTIDSWTALCRMCGVDGNDGRDVSRILGAIEEIKVESGVDVCFFLAHTAKGGDLDRPATRGASEVDEHVDTRWMLTVDKTDVRSIQTQGRDTQMTATSLDFDEETGRSTLGAPRQSVAAEGWVQEVTKIVVKHPEGLSESVLWDKMKQVRSITKPKAVEYMIEAEASGMIKRERVVIAGKGGRPPWMHYPPTSLQGTDRRMGATPREIDTRHAGAASKRRAART